ncbi:hypothetical protein [Synechococcus elongatus]|uniref:hypothetical protein n=1 Tax=Synechococcus elongatus TaxID=32046 RepID=UPI0030CD3AA1
MSHHLAVKDNRRDYGEKRVLSVSFLDDHMIMVGYTSRAIASHLLYEEMQCPRNPPLHAILPANLMTICPS